MDDAVQVPFEQVLAVPLRNGINVPSRHRGEGVKLVNMGELFAHDRIGPMRMELAPLPAGEPEKFLLRSGDLLFARQSLVREGAGKCSIVLDDPEPRTWEGHLIRARVERSIADPAFYYYWFRSHLGRAAVDTIIEQVAAAGIRGSDLARLAVPLPGLRQQQAIAGVLGALDDKIESNRRIWVTTLDLLEASRVRLAGAAEVTTATLGDLVAFNASTLKPGAPDARLVYVDIASVSPGTIDVWQEMRWSDAPSRARRGVSDGDVIFSTVRPTRRSFSVILDPDPEVVVSTGFAVMTPRAIGTTFLLATVADAEFVTYCEGASQGSAYPAVSPDAMAKYAVRLPAERELLHMESELMPVLRRGHCALTENFTLAALRDALLPELLSGRLRVREAEKVIEDVV